MNDAYAMLMQAPTTSHSYRPPVGAPASTTNGTTGGATGGQRTSTAITRHNTNATASQRFHDERKQTSVFVFPSHLANAASQAVHSGQFTSIIAFHAEHSAKYCTPDVPVRSPAPYRPPSNAAPIHSPASVPHNGGYQPRTPLMPADIKGSTSMPTTPAAVHPPVALTQLSSPSTYTPFDGGPPLNRPAPPPPLQASASNPLQQMERMTQESAMFEPPAKRSPGIGFGGVPSPSVAPVGSPAHLGNGAPPMINGDSDAAQKEAHDLLSREMKLARLKKVRDEMDKDTPANAGMVLPPQGMYYPGQRMMYAGGPPMHPQGMPPVGSVFHTPRGPMIMTPNGALPEHIFQQMQQQQRMQMQQPPTTGNTNPRKRKNTRLPPTSNAKPTMQVPPNVRQSRQPPRHGMPDPMGGYCPPPYMGGMPMPPNGHKMGGHPPHMMDGAMQYGYVPHTMGGPPTMQSVNNTYVNTNLHVQQLNIQNVAGNLSSAHMSAMAASAQGYGPPNGDGGAIPMRAPQPHPQQPPFSVYNQDSQLCRMPLTDLESKIPSQKLSYFPPGPSPNGADAYQNPPQISQMSVSSVDMNIQMQTALQVDQTLAGLNESDDNPFGQDDSGGNNDIFKDFES